MNYTIAFTNDQLEVACLSITSILMFNSQSHIYCVGDFSLSAQEELEHFTWVYPKARVFYHEESIPDDTIIVSPGDVAIMDKGSMVFLDKLASKFSAHKKKIKKVWHKKRVQKAKIALLIDEYFGAVGTAFGGYGFVARYIVGKYLPNRHIELEVILGRGRKLCLSTKHNVDGNLVYYLPKWRFAAKQLLKRKKYDAYLSIELVDTYALEQTIEEKRNLLLWIQDPRPKYDWDEINTVQLFKEFNYYNPKIYNFVNQLYKNKSVRFITQTPYLVKKAQDLYNLPSHETAVWVPNPVEIDVCWKFDVSKKENMVVYLGRLESVKRGWLFCEIARRLPQYQFYVLGKYHRDGSRNKSILSQYENLPNLHFVGHVEGKEKNAYLKKARLIVNTSIHEALPVSFLEALSYGTCIVSNQNPENITSRFGRWTGQILGDGFDGVDLFIPHIIELMENDTLYGEKARAGIDYIHRYHGINYCMNLLKEELKISIQSHYNESRN